MRTRFRRALAVVLIFLGVPSAYADATRDPASYFFHQSFGDLTEEAETARAQQQVGVLIMFETDDCPWCKRMKETVLNQVAVQDYFRRNFRILMVDTEGDTLITDFSGTEIAEKDFALKHNRVRATPVFAFFDLQGKLMTKYTGATRDPQEFLWLGEFVVDGHYRNTRFTKYKRKKRAAARNNS